VLKFLWLSQLEDRSRVEISLVLHLNVSLYFSFLFTMITLVFTILICHAKYHTIMLNKAHNMFLACKIYLPPNRKWENVLDVSTNYLSRLL